jgi:hypothetical protein
MRAAAFLVLSLAFTGSAVQAQRVTFDRPAYRLHSIGQRLTVRVLDGAGRAIPNPTFRADDPSIATVNPRGEVISRKEGFTKVWAKNGRDSASAFVTVEQRAARFAFSPTTVRFDALTARIPLRVQVSDSAGVPIAGNGSAIGACRSLNDEIVTITPSGEVVSMANGATYIRCADRGFADSVRVEVRQRAQRAQVVGSKSLSKTVGDTFTVRLRATDRQQKDVADARATWVSLDPKTVSVDPATGRALAKAEGFTRVIAQLGDVADTANVSVSAGRGGGLLLAPTAPVVDTTAAVKPAARPTISLSPLILSEGETKPLAYTVRDTLGNPINDARVVIRSQDTATVQPLDSGRVKGKKPGMIYVTLRYGTIIDSTTVNVRAKGDTTSSNLAGSGGDTTAANFDPPKFQTDVYLARYRRERDSALTAITTSEQFAKPSGRTFNASLYAGLASHSSNQRLTAQDTTAIIDDRSGVMYGGRGQLKPFSWMSLSGELRLGELTAGGTIGEPMKITEASGEALVYLMPWLGLGGGYTLRAEKTEIATQHWSIPKAMVQARSSFVGDAISTVSTIYILPGAYFSGMPSGDDPDAQQPNIGFGGEAGLELRRGKLDAGLFYYVDKFEFPEVQGRTRIDQFSTLRIRIGFKIGR